MRLLLLLLMAGNVCHASRAHRNLSGAEIEALLSTTNSGKRVQQLKIIDDSTTLTTGDNKVQIVVPEELDGYNLVNAHAYVTTAATTGSSTFQIFNVTDSVDMLSTAITIDANEKTSYTAATAPVIDTANDDVSTGDFIGVDVDAAANAVKGLGVVLTFGKP